jgi:tetratricopeptide (TPR) repeat protein
VNVSGQVRQIGLATKILLVLILWASLGLRLHDLGGKGLRGDEIFTDLRSNGSLIDVLTMSNLGLGTGGREIDELVAQVPLVYAVTHVVRRLGDGPFFLRLQAAFSGVLGIAILSFLGRQLYNQATGALGAGLLAISPLHVWFSQDARYYPLLVVLSLLSLILLLRALEADRWYDWLGFSLVTALTLYNHHFGLLVLAAEGLFAVIWWLWHRPSSKSTAWLTVRGLLARLGPALALIVLLCLPLAPVWHQLLRQYSFGGGEASGTDIAILQSGWLADWLAAFGAGSGWRMWLYLVPFMAGLLTSVLEGRTGLKTLLLTVLWLAVPLVTLLILQPSKSLSYRHLIFLLPFYLLVVAHGTLGVLRLAGRMSRSAVKAAVVSFLLLVFVLGSVAPLRAYYSQEKQNWRAAAALVQQAWRPGEVLLTPTRYRAECVRYYAPDLPVAQVPASAAVFASLADAHQGAWWVRAWSANELYDRQIDAWLQKRRIEPIVFRGSWSPVLVHHWRKDVAAAADRRDLLEIAANLAPHDAALQADLGDAYREGEMWQSATVQYQKALGLDPSLADAHVGLGLVWQAQGQLNDALAAYQRATELEPEHGLAHRLLGDGYRATGQAGRAATAYERALEANPAFADKAWFHLRLGQAYFDSNQLAAAKRAFERVLEVEPGNASAYDYLERIQP